MDAYIQDVKTLLTLHMEAAKLNLGFYSRKPKGSADEALQRAAAVAGEIFKDVGGESESGAAMLPFRKKKTV